MKNRTKMFAFVALVASLSGCGYPAFTSSIRPNFPPDAKVEMKCELIEMNSSRDVVDLNTTFNKYSPDGWRLAYLSEYTSTGISTFSNLVCFERMVK